MSKYFVMTLLLLAGSPAVLSQAPEDRYMPGVHVVPSAGSSRNHARRRPNTPRQHTPQQDASDAALSSTINDLYNTMNRRGSGGVSTNMNDVGEVGAPSYSTHSVFVDSRLEPLPGQPPEVSGDATPPYEEGKEMPMRPTDGVSPESNQGNTSATANGFEHDHLHKVFPIIEKDDDLGTNIVPFDTDSMHHHHEHDHSDGEDGHGAHTADDSNDNRTGKDISLNYDLCDLCLCDRNHTNIFCEKDHTLTFTRNVTLEANRIPPTAVSIQLKGFDWVTVRPDAFASANSLLERLSFEDINEIRLHAHSLHFSQHSKENMKVMVTMVGCNVPVMPSYCLTQLKSKATGKQDDQPARLSLEKTRFITITMYRCTIGTIESHALYRTRLLYFNLTDVTIGSMSRKSIDVDVYNEWVVQECQLPPLPEEAVCLNAEKSVVFSRNLMKEIGSNALNVMAGGQVLFEYNTVNKIRTHAFLNIRPMRNSRSANIVFLNNTVLSGEAESLVTNSEYPQHERKVLNNRFKIECECNISTHFKSMLGIREDSNDIQTYEAVLFHSMCQPIPGSPHYMYVKHYLHTECAPVPVLVIVATTVVLAILLASVIVSVVCARRATRAKEESSYLGECSSKSFSTMNTNAPLSPGHCDNAHCNIFYDAQGKPSWVMAVPEVKTYQETEVHVTYEESHPIHCSARSSCNEHVLDVPPKNITRQSCPFN